MSDRLEEGRLRRLVELGPALVSELDTEAVLDRLLETAREVTGAKYAALGVLDSERRQLDRFITRGLSDDEERAIGAPTRARRPRPRCRHASTAADRRCERTSELVRLPGRTSPDAELSRRADHDPRRGMGQPVPDR